MRIWPFTGVASCLMAVCTSFLCHTAHAAMYVYPMETTVGESGTAQIRVISQNDEVEFVRIKLKKITNPGTKNEREVEADMSDAGQIIVTPQKIALAAGGERVVRIVSMTPPEKETTWRVYFEGVSETVFNAYSDEKSQAGKAAQVGVNIIWGALVHVAPRKARASLRYIPSTGNILNDGTLRIPVTEVGVCSPGGECRWEKKALTVYPESEVPVPGMRFSPGNAYKIKYFDWTRNRTEETDLPASQAN